MVDDLQLVLKLRQVQSLVARYEAPNRLQLGPPDACPLAGVALIQRLSSATALQRPVDERLAHSQVVTDLSHRCTSFSVACVSVWRGAGARVRGAHVLVTISFSNSSPLRFLIAATDRSRRQRTRQAPIWRARRQRQTRARPEGLCFWSKSTSLQVSKSSRETFGEFYVQLKTAIKPSIFLESEDCRPRQVTWRREQGGDVIINTI